MAEYHVSELKIGCRPTGRPMLRFKDVCRRDTKACNINTTSWETVERGIWRVKVREGPKANEEKRNVKIAHQLCHRPTFGEYVKRTVTPELVCTVTADAVQPITDSPGA